MSEEKVWELALATNAAFKGLFASLGQSGHICARTNLVEVQLPLTAGWDAVLEVMVDALYKRLSDGDVVVVADKVIAVALGRLAPAALLTEPDPKTVPPTELSQLADKWQERLGFLVTTKHLLLADQYGPHQATVGTDDPNARAAELALLFQARLGRCVDVIISDTDTGLDTRMPLIDTITIAATPIGATAGVNLYEAMRCAVAAEFGRGHDRGIPIVICCPAERRRRRPRQGERRDYPGLLSRLREKDIAHA